MKRTLITIALATLALSSTAQSRYSSYFYTANDMNTWISEGTQVGRMRALSFVAGVSDATHGLDHCTPENVTVGQTLDMVKKTLEAAPELRHNSAASFVVFTLKAAFPCPAKRGGNNL